MTPSQAPANTIEWIQKCMLHSSNWANNHMSKWNSRGVQKKNESIDGDKIRNCNLATEEKEQIAVGEKRGKNGKILMNSLVGNVDLRMFFEFYVIDVSRAEGKTAKNGRFKWNCAPQSNASLVRQPATTTILSHITQRKFKELKEYSRSSCWYLNCAAELWLEFALARLTKQSSLTGGFSMAPMNFTRARINDSAHANRLQLPQINNQNCVFFPYNIAHFIHMWTNHTNRCFQRIQQ